MPVQPQWYSTAAHSSFKKCAIILKEIHNFMLLELHWVLTENKVFRQRKIMLKKKPRFRSKANYNFIWSSSNMPSKWEEELKCINREDKEEAKLKISKNEPQRRI
jgi:hypothetical protein